MKKDERAARLSPLGTAVLFLTAVFLAFLLGWFLRGSGRGEAVRVETQRSLGDRETLALSTPRPTRDPGKRININTAPAGELQELPGIGAKRAADIVAYREANGPFRIVEELTDVPGIGEGILAGLIEYITVEDTAEVQNENTGGG